MDIRTWYGSSVWVPTYHSNSHRYAQFAASCIGLVRTVFKTKLDRDVSVRFTDGGSGAAQQENGIIYLNREYLKGKFQYYPGLVPSDDALTAVLGVIVHEAAHFAYSPKTLEPYLSRIEKETKWVYDPNAAATLSNVIEDIFIEYEVCKNIPSLAWMVETCRETLFRQDRLDEYVGACAGIEGTPKDDQQILSALNLLIFAKAREGVAGLTPYMERLFSLIRTATELTSLADRIKLAVVLYEMLMENAVSPPEEEMEEVFGESVGSTVNHMPGSGSDEKPMGIDSDILNRSLDRLDDVTVTMENVPGDEESSMSLFLEQVVPEDTSPVPIDNRYVALAEWTRQRTTVNKPYGLNRTTGHTITRLHRIATDQKIFSERVKVNTFKPMQVVILVDCSGSMQCPIGGVRSGKTRLTEATSAAAGAAMGLMEGHCEVAVYGHSADLPEAGNVNIYRFKSFGDPISSLSNRLQTVRRRDYTNENRDGYAIFHMGKKFASTKRKMLIVISDGDPRADHYSGPKANRHTKEQVDALRAKGIEVLSISITEEARVANDYIYGKAWNVFNEDPNVIESIVRSLYA